MRGQRSRDVFTIKALESVRGAGRMLAAQSFAAERVRDVSCFATVRCRDVWVVSVVVNIILSARVDKLSVVLSPVVAIVVSSCRTAMKYSCIAARRSVVLSACDCELVHAQSTRAALGGATGTCRAVTPEGIEEAL